jgi:hypothetical protein
MDDPLPDFHRLIELLLAREAGPLVIQSCRMLWIEPEDSRKGFQGLYRAAIL